MMKNGDTIALHRWRTQLFSARIFKLLVHVRTLYSVIWCNVPCKIVHNTFTPSIYLTDITMRVNESSLSTKACDWLTIVCRQERGESLRGWNKGRVITLDAICDTECNEVDSPYWSSISWHRGNFDIEIELSSSCILSYQEKSTRHKH